MNTTGETPLPVTLSEEEPSSAPCHGRWVGVVCSLFFAGSGQFLAGMHRRGILWRLSFPLLYLAAILAMTSGVPAGVFIGLVLAVLWLALFLVMLQDSAHPIPKKKWWLPVLVVILGIGLSNAERRLFRSIAVPFKIPSGSMSPTLQPGDRVAVARYTYWFSPPRRGDLVVFRTGGLLPNPIPGKEYFIKRIVGLPGEEISIRSGRIVADGETILSPSHFSTTEYIPSPHALYLTKDGETLLIPEEHYFVIGDSVENSFDSRVFGPIRRGSILGKAASIWWPPERIRVVE